MNKKASIELSVNFLVVMIICLVLLGIGIFLMSKFINTANTWKNDVDYYHKELLRKAMYDGALVYAIPTRVTVNRGELAEIYLGINNELGTTQDFSVFIENKNIIPGNQPTPIYLEGPYTIKNNEQQFIRMGIKVPKDAGHGTHIFNVYVCNATQCSNDPVVRYGELQQLYINVK